MESYPAELLVGVFPLVFCVDATLTSKAAAGQASGDYSSVDVHVRSQFDRFLDAMAASLLDEPAGGLFEEQQAGSRRRNMDDGMMSLFRGDEGELDSDQEDYMILGGDSTGLTMTMGNTSLTEGINEADSSLNSSNKRGGRPFSKLSFPRLGRDGSMGNAVRNAALRATPSTDTSVGTGGGIIDTSFARTFQDGQGFFQRARIVSISSRHGFPPSKDPSGESGRTRDFFLGKTMRTTRILAATKRRPMDGILPSGWLEKHAAALPSVILVVVQVSSHQTQHDQDAILQDTMQNLLISLASKRQCTIRIVGLVQDGISTSMATEWQQKMSDSLEGSPPVTLLEAKDLLQDAGPSTTLQTLHKTVHDASFRYYKTQARRTKHKLYELGPARGTPLLLPLCIRYCFKVAMFYEFQWNPEKALKYMVEAYRHVETYYRYLLQQREIANSGTDDSAAARTTANYDAPKARLFSQSSTVSMEGESEGVEMSLPNNEDDVNNLLLNPPAVPEDMVHQCRVLADWLNFKILQLSLTSHTEGGLLAASAQLQKHVQAFCNPMRSFICSPDHAYMDWSFMAHQRMVTSQLLERNPPRGLGELGADNDELLLRCSPWRAYQSAAEALLRLGAEVKKATNAGTTAVTMVDDMRSRYVGGLDKNGYQPKLQEELKVNHRQLALDCLFRAISLYERDIEKQEKDNDGKSTACWNRSGARLYYLAGGTLLGMERYAEATSYLGKAAKLAAGWKGLEVTIRKMVVECYAKYTPEEESGEDSQTLASILLDSYFNAEMSNADLRRALEKFASSSGGGTIKWYRECFDEADHSLPFSFAVTFPSTTHATAGDSVEAILHIKSNLDYAVHVNAVTLLSLAGKVAIPSADLLSAKNANEGIDGGIIIQSKADIWVSTLIKLPNDLDEIAIDEAGNGGEKKVTAGKGSFAKTARPRTGGITSGAGARLASEDVFGDGGALSGKSQWSAKCLGGKPLKCDGLCMEFYPMHSSGTSSGKNTPIELVIEKKPIVTAAEIKRTPFEEENYISASWMRPLHLPMKLGPRCLRVSRPLPDIIVTNVTESFTNGKVLEGTVNRILVRIKAGQQEVCNDVAIRVSCSSVLVSATGVSTKITSTPPEDEENAAIVDPKNPFVRTPVLVSEDKGAPAQMTEYGYEIPKGWVIVGEDGQNPPEDDYLPVSSMLKTGDHAYAVFHVFRPSPPLTRKRGAVQPGEDDEGMAYEQSTCQSDIDISIRYRQDRSMRKGKGVATKHRGRRKPSTEDGVATTGDEESDLVELTETMSVVWSAPLSATFSPGLKSTHPSGNRHPTNVVADPSTRKSPNADAEMVLVDKERVTVRCILEAAASADGLTVNVEDVSFQDTQNENAPCTFTLLSGKDDSGLLYKSRPDDPCKLLVVGSKFSLAWTSEVHMKSHYLKGSVSASLGTISVGWSPSSFEVPKDMSQDVGVTPITAHGPLRLDGPSNCLFMGPPCYIENAPFETTMDRLPDYLEVATPFDIRYHIKNKTSLDQKLKVSLKGMDGPEGSLGFMVAGMVQGEISLGPFETHTLSYTALATRSGKIHFPPVCVSSERYKTWLIQEEGQSRTVFVAP